MSFKYEVTYTKRFVPGSLLHDIEITEADSNITLDIAVQRVKWCREHKDVPVTACAGSDYTISSYDVKILEL